MHVAFWIRSAVTTARMLERTLIHFIGVFGLAVAADAYFRRRMNRHLVRPAASTDESVLKLEAGEYTNRIEVACRVRLGRAGRSVQLHVAVLYNGCHWRPRFANRPRLAHGLAICRVVDRTAGGIVQSRQRPQNRARKAWSSSIIQLFKDVNDFGGHAGDALLVELAADLLTASGRTILVAAGGDEFAIVVEQNSGSTARLLSPLLAALRLLFVVNGARLPTVSVSIGVAVGPWRPSMPPKSSHADFAMYVAKGAGVRNFSLSTLRREH